MRKAPQWSEIFNTTYTRWQNGIESASDAAKNANYPFYVWNGIIYNTETNFAAKYRPKISDETRQKMKLRIPWNKRFDSY